MASLLTLYPASWAFAWALAQENPPMSYLPFVGTAAGMYYARNYFGLGTYGTAGLVLAYPLVSSAVYGYLGNFGLLGKK
jgi:hypothetical protein